MYERLKFSLQEAGYRQLKQNFTDTCQLRLGIRPECQRFRRSIVARLQTESTFCSSPSGRSSLAHCTEQS